MEPNVTYNWKKKDYEHIDLVKSFINAFIKEISDSSGENSFEFIVAQSDRLVDFSILTIIEKKIKDFEHDKLFKRWETLELTNPGIDRSRSYVDPETKIELEVFIMKEDQIFHIYTHSHFNKPIENTEKKIFDLGKEGKALGSTFKNVINFFKNG
ncbi:hypothetical protein OAK75_11125 [Bacteriovoracales bacterium]|nr:hypothetical protein [Bacteriovoracales bacterium]